MIKMNLIAFLFIFNVFEYIKTEEKNKKELDDNENKNREVIIPKEKTTTNNTKNDNNSQPNIEKNDKKSKSKKQSSEKLKLNSKLKGGQIDLKSDKSALKLKNELFKDARGIRFLSKYWNQRSKNQKYQPFSKNSRRNIIDDFTKSDLSKYKYLLTPHIESVFYITDESSNNQKDSDRMVSAPLYSKDHAIYKQYKSLFKSVFNFFN
ncbi:hypothetical protein EDEG_03270 [Edhazardia aedis USNM 41457]|uniref:Uncharacterized protein n=1 Tax=Edhazardia aedis (strain USNM 41457) TaxID=1003232 RepID=J9DLP1_EDHAE|nr:hypothetical protein EDEG_03270 [Edhazardia aedis USNM 41457]|eukprot:EJW02287.1 hypothetical protein EDEG_03270 [Edhazardia aedis USNM 41457]